MNRNGFFRLVLSALLVLALGQPSLGAAAPIKLGLLEDASGIFALATIPKIHATQLAVGEINAHGGILGRPIQLIAYDTQSDNTKFQEMSRRLIQTDHADVIFGGFSSASREAIRPIMDRASQLYWYNNQYEGGVCDSNTFVTGAVPEQQFSTLIPWLMEKYGKRVYTIAADYNFGQISAQWVRDIVRQNGGTMVGEEFIPLSVSQFGQTIQNIQKARPDFVVTLLVGANQASYYEQQASAHLNLPMGSSVNVGQAYEHKRFKAPALKDMYVTANYVEEVNSPASNDFKRRFHAKFPNEPYINQEAANAYDAVYLYKAAVERARSADQHAVAKALEAGGICTTGPSGKVCFDPKSHHLSHTIYLIHVKADHSVDIPKVWNDVQPYWLGQTGCNLPVKPDHRQFSPDNAFGPQAGGGTPGAGSGTIASTVYSAVYQFGDTFAYLVLAALGLAVIFGMMGVINLAHGEFIMCGAYVTIIAAKRGVPLPLAMLMGSLAAAAAGIVIERLVIRRLYGRLLDSVVATWAISLIVQQMMLLIAGPSIEGISTPFGSFAFGGYSFSVYRAVLPLIALAILGALYWLLFRTNYGVCARATIQNARMAQCLGLRTDRIYALTFALGAGLAGLTGALYAPTMTAVPTMGSNFIVQAFVTVVVGGSNVIAGTIPAAAALGLIQTGMTAWYGQLFGQIALLVAVILVIRLMPQGVGNLFRRRR